MLKCGNVIRPQLRAWLALLWFWDALEDQPYVFIVVAWFCNLDTNSVGILFAPYLEFLVRQGTHKANLVGIRMFDRL
jgi:hypothetical protein